MRLRPRTGIKTHPKLILRQIRIISPQFVKERAALLGAGILKASLEHTAAIRMRGQIKHSATEGPHKCHPLADDAFQHLLHDVVTVGVADAAQNVAVELAHERSLLIGEKIFDSLKGKRKQPKERISDV